MPRAWPSGVASLCAVAGTLTLSSPAHAAEGDVLVRFKADTSAAERQQARRDADVSHDQTLPVTGIQVVSPDPGVSATHVAGELDRNQAVLYAEVDRRRHATMVADDALFGSQWGLERINAPAAWEVTTGSPEVLVAIADSGVDLDHPDLAPNLVAGWDFVERDAIPQDAWGHGTHVAGTVGARGNNHLGVAGVTWSSRLMPLRVLDERGRGRVSDMVSAYAYAAEAGVRVVNMSFGGTGFSHAERDALSAADDVLFVAGAGNSGDDDDRRPFYPCAYDLANVACVTASDRADQLPAWANFGAESVDLAAPGEGIESTTTGDLWGSRNGTSMAVPHVTGTAALMLAVEPRARPVDLVAALTGTASPAAAFAGRTVTGGLLDAAAAVTAVTASPAPLRSGIAVTPPSPVPEAAPDPTLPTTRPPSVTDARGPRRAARLRLRSADVHRGRLQARLQLTGVAAGGTVHVTYRARGHKARFTARVGRRGGVRFNRRLPRVLRRARGTLTVRWRGSAAVRPARISERITRPR